MRVLRAIMPQRLLATKTALPRIAAAFICVSD
jgi:hypothetical protein